MCVVLELRKHAATAYIVESTNKTSCPLFCHVGLLEQANKDDTLCLHFWFESAAIYLTLVPSNLCAARQIIEFPSWIEFQMGKVDQMRSGVLLSLKIQVKNEEKLMKRMRITRGK